MAARESKFDVAAASWDASTTRVNLARKLAETIQSLPWFKANSFDAMDFGSGTGLISFSLLPTLKSLVGVDSSDGMTEVFNRKVSEGNITNAVALNMFLKEPRQLDKQFDLIFSGMVLHHIKDVPAMIHLLVSYLKNGGFLALSDFEATPNAARFHSPHDAYKEETHHPKGFVVEDIKKCFRDAGLTDVNATFFQFAKPVDAAWFPDRKDQHAIAETFSIFVIHGQKNCWM